MRLGLLLGGCLLIAVAGLVEPGLDRAALIAACSLLGLDLGLSVLGPLLHERRQKIVERTVKSESAAPIPESVKQRAVDVRRRLGVHTTDRRTLLDEERRGLGL